MRKRTWQKVKGYVDKKYYDFARKDLKWMQNEIVCTVRGTHKPVLVGYRHRPASVLQQGFKEYDFKCSACGLEYTVGEINLTTKERAIIEAVGKANESKDERN
jgi:hypothetical protein